jgi:hypothetical protein
MNRPIFRDTRHLTEEQKCLLALEQAMSQEHGEHRIHELRERLMKFSIMNLNVGITIEIDDGEE